MNKTLSIGLAGFSFVIEEHAYIKLSDYLAALRASLDKSEADEVMHDIEIRMVEIFKDSLGKREVINDGDVERVISQIGKPEVIEEQEEAYFSEKTQKVTDKTHTGNRQLFRDPSMQKIAGVCAGLAHYTGMDVRLMRTIWLGIAILGIFTAAISTSLIVLIYIVLWAVLPKAETASDFLKMKGQPVNFDTLKAESNKIVQFANESTQRVGEIYTENKPYINQAGSGLWNVIRYILGGLFAFMAVGSVMGIFAIFGIFGSSDFSGMNELDFYFGDSSMSWVLRALMVIGALFPALLFGFLAVKLLSPKTQIRNMGYVLGALFLAVLALGTYFGINMAKKDMIYKGHKEDAENIAINTASDSILIDVKSVNIPQKFTAYDNDLYSDRVSVFKEDFPFVEVSRKLDVQTPYLIVKRDAEGYNVPVDLKVPVEIQENKVLLPNFVEYPYNHRFRDYNVTYELVVPQNAKVISLNKDKMTLRGDLDGDGSEDDDDNNATKSEEKTQITINGKTWNFEKSSNSDSIIVNGKKYPGAVAEKMMDSMKVSFKNLEDVNINIKNGKKEISIKTNK